MFPEETSLRVVFRSISVAGRPPVEVCLREGVGDQVVPWLLEHDWIDEPVMRAFAEQVHPGARVLDLGAHLGLFGLTAARLGAQVIAVDAVPDHVGLLRRAAERNGFADLEAVHAAIADRSGRTVRVVTCGIHSHVTDADEGLKVPTLSVDDLLDARDWATVDLVKLDIEGSELAALRGMRRLLARGCRPVFVFESNGATLPGRVRDVARLRDWFTRRGYRLAQIDHLRPGTLMAPGPVQPECVVDCVALPEGRDAAAGWTVAPALTRAQVVARLVDHAAVDWWPFRRYVAELLRAVPAWLGGDPLLVPVRRALADDLELRVREAVAVAPPRAWRTPAGPADPDVAVLARDVTLAADRDALARAPGQPRPLPRSTLVRGVSVHVRRGTFLGVVGGGAEQRAALMAALAGRVDVTDGELATSASPLLLGSLTEVFEPELSFAENVAIGAAFLGGDVGVAAARAAQLAESLGVARALDEPLQHHAADIAVCLALRLLLDGRAAELLLLDGLTQPRHDATRDWCWRRARALCAEGVTIVQAAGSAEALLGPPTRLAYLHDGELRAAGHPGSVADVASRHALGLPDHTAARRRRPLREVA